MAELASGAAAVIVMGVSGSGKSTVGRRIARRLGCEFADGDDYHSDANVDKMAAGVPLDDVDRQPWLERLHELLADRLERGQCIVLACSALKQRYRDTLRAADPRVHFLYLSGNVDTISARMQARRQHYMKPGMLESQFDALEEPTDRDAVVVDVRGSLGKVVRKSLAGLAARGVVGRAGPSHPTDATEPNDPTEAT